MTAIGGSPIVVVVMGVSGSGKSTVGQVLADDLGCPYFDGDAFHAPESIAKMQRGIPLTEQDRLPWLGRIAAKIDAVLNEGRSAVFGCSALKRAYRDILIGGRPRVVLVYLKGSYELILGRIAAREGHFMPASLLKNQFDMLQEPGPDEHAVTVYIAASPEDIAAGALRQIEPRRSGVARRA